LEKILIVTCRLIFLAALLTIGKWWKQPKCPSTDEWTKNIWHIHRRKYHSAIKRDEILIPATTGMNLKDMMLNQRSQIYTIG